jgi:hypothetical protein
MALRPLILENKEYLIILIKFGQFCIWYLKPYLVTYFHC